MGRAHDVTKQGQSGTVYFAVLVDSSSSMGELMDEDKTRAVAVNAGYRAVVSDLHDLSREQPMISIKIRPLMFETTCRWLSDWQEVGPDCLVPQIVPAGTTNLGGALRMVADGLSELIATDSNMLGAAVLVISDGVPTDAAKGLPTSSWIDDFRYFDESPAGAVALRAAINVCGASSREVLEAFTRDPEMVMDGNSAGQIKRRLARLAVHMTRQASLGVMSGVVSRSMPRKSILKSISQGNWGKMQGGGRSTQRVPSPARATSLPATQQREDQSALRSLSATRSMSSRGLRSLAPGGQTNWIDLATRVKK